MTNYMDLRAELALPPYAGKTDLEAADLLNAKVIDHPLLTVGVADLMKLTMTTLIPTSAGPRSLWLVVKKLSTTSPYFEQLWDVFANSNNVPLIDFKEGGVQRILLDAGLDELVADQSITFGESDKAALLVAVLALAPKISRAEQLGLGVVTELDVSRARQHGN